MKLITYDKTYRRRFSSDNAYIFIRRSGLIMFSTTLCKFLNLSDKEQISFHQKINNSAVWYFQRVKNDGFILRENKATRKHSLQLNNIFVANKIFESLGSLNSISAYIPVSNILIDNKYYELELKNAKPKQSKKV